MQAATYMDRKVAGLCTYPGCIAPPADDALQCETHQRAANKRASRTRAKLRKLRRKNGRCAECGINKSKRFRCPACQILVNRAPRHRGNNGGNKRARVAARITVGSFAGEEGRSRYRGALGRKGPPGKAREDATDLADARLAIDRALAGLAYARSPEVLALPLAQRKEAERAALSQADHGARFIDAVLERNRYHGRSGSGGAG